MCPPQIIERPNSVAQSLQRARSREKGRDNSSVWCAIGAKMETASAKSGDGSNYYLRDETLASIVAELILAVLDVNRLKMRLGLCRG